VIFTYFKLKYHTNVLLWKQNVLVTSQMQSLMQEKQ